MINLEITTNKHWNPFLYSNDITESEKLDFDYMDDISEGTFFRYRGVVYSTDSFMRIIHGDDNLKDWHGYHSNSAFSGVLIKFSDCGDSYQIGTYYSP